MGHIELGEVLRKGHPGKVPGFQHSGKVQVSTHVILNAKAEAAKAEKAKEKKEKEPKPTGADDGKLKHQGDAKVSTRTVRPKRKKLPGTPQKDERLEKVLQDNGEAWAKGEKAEEKAPGEKAPGVPPADPESRFSK